MIKLNMVFLFLLTVVILSGCVNHNYTSSDIDAIQVEREQFSTMGNLDLTTSNPNATEDAKSILKYLGALSSDSEEGVISGQQCGHGEQLAIPDHVSGYTNMVKKMGEETGKWVGMIGMDYEFDEIYTTKKLSKGNQVLIDYWNKGGLVAVNWTPTHPSTGKRPDVGGKVDLESFFEPGTKNYKYWQRQLERVADGLTELRDAGVVVLWRPMQEMNGSWFWFSAYSERSRSFYIDFYQDMYNYFVNERGLNNLLWVFSPNVAPRDFELDYPGDDYVDIVAPTDYNTKLTIRDYDKYITFNKPLAIAEYGVMSWGKNCVSKLGELDTNLYRERLIKQYPRMAYWMSWSNWNNGDGTSAHMSIYSNLNYKELLESPQIITREKINWKKY